MKTDGYVVIGTKVDLSGIEQGLNNLATILEKKSTSAAEKAGRQSAKRFNAAFALGVSALSSIMTKLISSITNTIGDSISRVDTLENFPRVMSSLGISSKDSAESVNYLSEKLTGLPTTLDDAVNSVKRFTSANNNVKASTEMFLAMNNAILAGGASTQIQQAAIEQLSQAYARGKPEMNEWKTALIAMPAQLKQVAIAMGYVNANDLYEALRDGKVTMNDFMATLIKMNREGINGFASLEEQARTGTQGIQTSLVNLKTAVVKAGAEILQTIGQANIANFFQTIINMIRAAIPYIAAFARSVMAVINFIYSLLSKVKGVFGKKANSDVKLTTNAIKSTGVAMKNLSKNTDKATGSAKKLKKEMKSLAAFDEMNLLQDVNNQAATKGGTGGAGGAGGAGDVGDLSALGNLDNLFGDLDTKLGKLKVNTDKFVAAMWGLISAWAAFKALKLLKSLGLLSSSIGQLGIAAVGVGITVAGLILTVKDAKKFIENPSWKTFLNLLGSLSLTLIGISVTLLAINASNPVGWVIAGIGLVGGLVSIFGKLLTANEKETNSLVNSKKATEELKKAKEDLASVTGEYTNAVKNAEKAQKELKDAEKKTGLSGKELFDQVEVGILKYEKMNDVQREVFDAYVANKEAQKNLTEQTAKFNDARQKTIDKSGQLSGAIYTETGKYDNYFNTLVDGYKKGQVNSEDFTNSVVNMYHNMDKKSRETFMKNLPEDLKNAVKTNETSFKNIVKTATFQMDRVRDSAKKTFEQDVPNSINKSLDKNKYQKKADGIKSLFSGLADKIHKAVSAAENTKVTIKTNQKKKNNAKGAIYLPKLAVGGIINMPGRGMPLGTAIGGERGAEGVIPLTDSQQMELLGEAIGKYININATVPVYVGNRQIAREIRKINAEDDFAYNR